MVGRRNGEREVGVVPELRQVGGRVGHDLGGRVVEALCPVECRVRLAGIDAAQVVHDVAAGHDEDTAVA